MDANSKLRAIAWVYILFGSCLLLEQIASFFAPFENPLMWLYILIPEVNLYIVILPIGIGLLKRNRLCLKLAKLINYLFLIGLILFSGFFLICSVGGNLEFEFEKTPSTIEDTIKLIELSLIILVIYIWQFRGIRSKEVRNLVEEKEHEEYASTFS